MVGKAEEAGRREGLRWQVIENSRNSPAADRARDEERRRLVEELIRELPKLDPFVF